jgi:hypothetical protein
MGMAEADVLDRADGLDIDAGKCRRYHDYQRSYWSGLDYWRKGMSVVFGTGTFVAALKGWPELTLILSSVLAVFTAADLVLGFSARARNHDALYRKYSELGVKIILAANPTDADVREWEAERLRIEADEPPAKDWLERRCAREEHLGRGRAVNDAWKIGRFKTLMARHPWFPNW